MARFGLSPYSNPVESALQSFGTGIRDLSALQELTSGNRQREEQQRIELNDLNIRNAQRQSYEADAAAPNKELERTVKNNELHTKIATQTYGPGIGEAMQEIKLAKEENRPPRLSANALASVLGFANERTHLGGKTNNEEDHVTQAVAANKVQQGFLQLAPALTQHAQQTGQTLHRIDNTNAPGFIDDINTAFKESNVFEGKEVEALGVDVGTGEVTVRVKGKEGPEILKDKDGNPKKFNITDLQNMVSKSASFGNLVLSAYGQINGDDATMKEVAASKKALAQTHARSATLDEYSEWSDQNPDATVAERRMKIQKLGARHNVDEATLDKIAKEVIAEKTAKPRNLQRVQSGASDVLVDPEAEGGPKEVWRGAPKPKSEVGGSASESKVAARKDKLVNQYLGRLGSDPDWKERSYDERQAEAERLSEAQIAGRSTSPTPEMQRNKGLKKLTTWMKGFKKEGLLTGTDIEGTIQGAIDKGHSIADLEESAAKLPEDNEAKDQILKAIEKAKPVEKKPERQVSQRKPSKEIDSMPSASGYSGKILRDNQTGKRYKSDGKRWNEIS